MAQNTQATANAQENAARQAQLRQAAITAGLSATGQQAGIDQNQFGAAQSTEEQIAAREAANRGETRTERGYQTQTAQDAVAAAIAQHQLERGDANTTFNQNLATAQYANTGNPAAAYSAAAGNAGATSAESQAQLQAMLKDYYAKQRATAPAGR